MGNSESGEKKRFVNAEETKKMGTVEGLKPENRMPAFMFEEENREKKKLNVKNCDLPPEFDGKDRLLAFVIEEVFSKEECKEMVEWTEKYLKYEAALLNIGNGLQMLNTDARNHARAIYDSKEMVNIMFDRMKDYLPEKFAFSKPHDREIRCLNERLRFLKYKEGGYFAPHWDGRYTRPDQSETSYLTVILYLNESPEFEGGETNFLATLPSGDKSKQSEWPVGIQTGSVLCFQHNIYHEGALLEKGVKYCVRTDVMYDNTRREVKKPSKDKLTKPVRNVIKQKPDSKDIKPEPAAPIEQAEDAS